MEISKLQERRLVLKQRDTALTAELNRLLDRPAGTPVSVPQSLADSELNEYAARLDGKAYDYATEYPELNTIKQLLKYFAKKELLPVNSLFEYPLRKPEGTDTYCGTSLWAHQTPTVS